MADYVIDLEKDNAALLEELADLGVDEEMAREIIAIARNAKPPDRVVVPERGS